MMAQARFERDHGDEHEHEQDATSTTDHGPLHPNGISDIIPNPLTDTTTTLSEDPRPEIYTNSQDVRKSTDKRPEDSWNSNTLTLNNHTQSNQTQTQAFKKLSTTTQAAIDRQNGIDHDWEETWEKERLAKWREKVEVDLKGWRGGNGTPRSNYCPTALPSDASYFGGPVSGTIGRDLPKEFLRIERDWTTGDICQFESSFPIELDRRITPSKFQEFIFEINTKLLSAYSTRAAVIDNLIAIATWWTSLLVRDGHFEKELKNIEEYIKQANRNTFNPVGLNVLSPRMAALQFLEIEYY